MKYQDIVGLLQADPSDRNVAIARAWLTKRKQSGNATREVGKALLQVRHDQETLNWLSLWLKDREWDIPRWAVQSLQTVEIHDWLIQLAGENPTNSEASLLWSDLLSSYRDEALVEAASHWLITYGTGRDAIWVATNLLPLATNSEVCDKAKQLAEQFPDSEFLITRLIEHVGDERSIDLGLRLMDVVEPHIGSIIAASLLKSDGAKQWPAVEQWFQRNWNHKDADRFFQQVLHVAPLTVAPLAFDWLDERPKFRYASRLFSIAFVLAPSQDLIDLTWSWLRNRLSYRDAPGLLALLLGRRGTLKTPVEAVIIADTWLIDNLNHECSFTILLGAIENGATALRLELARKWLVDHSDSERGLMLLNLMRRIDNAEFVEQVHSWSERHPSRTESHAIVLEAFKRDPANLMPQVKKLLREQNVRFQQLFILELARAGDAESIQLTRDKLGKRSLERMHGESRKCRTAPILTALLFGVPRDPDILEHARLWLESDGKVCEEHLEQVRSAYEEALGIIAAGNLTVTDKPSA
jgi:hypothetical protein